jgi:phage terminase small subunit
MALNTRQLLFVEHYLKLNNATQAAIAAGYSERSARKIGCELLTKPDIATRIQQRTATVLRSAQMEADEVLSLLAAQARGSMEDFIRVNHDGEPVIDLSKPNVPLQLIKRIKTKRSEKFGDEIEFELYDAQTALNMLGKNLRLFDRAAEVDWREELRKAGISDGDLFEAAVQAYASRIETDAK